MQKVIFFLVALVAIAAAGEFEWENCDESSHFIASSASMSPYPPKKGSTVTITTAGVFDETVSGGTFTSTTYRGSSKMASNSGNVCDGLAKTCPCPCKGGSVTLSQTQTINAFAPTGEYTTEYKSYDQNGQPLACLKYSFTI